MKNFHKGSMHLVQQKTHPIKTLQRDSMNELEKYRPHNFYKEEGVETKRPAVDTDDYGWETNYQIGPETLLLATRGPEFNARVRDYRRELWGDSAPYVQYGLLGYRNADITVRERRRFTDLLREEPEIARSVENVSQEAYARHLGAVRRLKSDISQLAPQPLATEGGGADGTEKPPKDAVVATEAKQNGDAHRQPPPPPTRERPAEEDGDASAAEFAPIFRARLHNVCFQADVGRAALTLECTVIGRPTPEVRFFHHESALSEGGRYRIERSGDVATLTITNPLPVDAGEYSCVATNRRGYDKCSCSVLYGGARELATNFIYN